MSIKESVKLSRWGNSKGIRIPKNILKSLNISEDIKNVEFDISLDENKNIILTKQVEENNEENYLRFLFKNYETKNSDKVDFDWGEPRGHELF